MDNGRIRWFSVDLPDSIEVRRKVFAKREHEYVLAGDILKNDWVKEYVLKDDSPD